MDGVSVKSVNLAMGLEAVSPQKIEKKTPLSIVNITRGLTSVSFDEHECMSIHVNVFPIILNFMSRSGDKASVHTEPVDEAAIQAALAAVQ